MPTLERVLALLACASLLGLCAGAARAATYRVGAGERFATMQDLLAAVTLVDRDVVLVHPGTYPAFSLTRGGGASPETAPVIRAFDMAHLPVIDAAGARRAPAS